MATFQIDAQKREKIGRKVKQLRREGILPVTAYGPQKEPMSLQLDMRTFSRIVQSNGRSNVLEVNVEGGETIPVLIRELQRHPVSHSILHADLYMIDVNEAQTVIVPFESTGRPNATAAGTMVLKTKDYIEVEAVPEKFPPKFVIDITGLSPENPITVADLPEMDGVRYVTDPSVPLYTMMTARGS